MRWTLKLIYVHTSPSIAVNSVLRKKKDTKCVGALWKSTSVGCLSLGGSLGGGKSQNFKHFPTQVLRVEFFLQA